ncbi:hypothetical protein [Algiphilus sp.]|uniref:hypothetical protein n=1 Tax=Algiphilus sp. TaxID=1872431 RepID=UPI0025C4F330|nr:hypothetical protein [Algiphilus sp.]MCK5770937.1 hypothetical protein [Algiphilus sp.]
MARKRDNLVAVKVTCANHRHRGRPVPVGEVIRTSRVAADVLCGKGRGHLHNAPPEPEPAAEPAPETRDGEQQGGDATSDAGGEDDEDPASTGAGDAIAGEIEGAARAAGHKVVAPFGAGESFAGESGGAPAGSRAGRPGFLGRFGEV